MERDHARARAGPGGGRGFQPGDRGRGRRGRLARRRSRPLHEHPPGLLRPGVPAGVARPHPRAPRAAPRPCGSAGGRRHHTGQRACGARGGGGPDRRGQRHLRPRGPEPRLPAARARARPRAAMSFLERALELAERGRGITAPNPVVGAVVVRDGVVVGEGWHERPGGPHAEIVALEAAGERAGEELAWRARVQNEGFRVWAALDRPFVTYKAAMTLDCRVTVPGSRWVTGEESRRRVHELRAASDAVAVGMGTVRADAPRLDARGVGARRQPRRLAFGRGPLPEGSELELRPGQLADELRALAGEGVQTLLLEGGPTLATAFLRAGLVDKLLLFVAPILAGSGPRFVRDLEAPAELAHTTAERIGADVLLTGYLRIP